MRIPVALLITLIATAAVADILHPLAGGAYWHHDSGWIFPAKLASFSRVGAPQDVDGSSAVFGAYAWESEGVRVVAMVEVYPASTPMPEPVEGQRVFDLADKNGWHARVRVTVPRELPTTQAEVDAFVHAQRVETLGAVDLRCPNAGCGT